MFRNIDRYSKDLDSLIDKGEKLYLAIQAECHPAEFEKEWKKHHGEKAAILRKKIPSFKTAYQPWYTEAKILIKQLLPDRFLDFASHYEKPKTRKDITFENYRILDYLQNLHVNRVGWETTKIVGPNAAIPQFEQQLGIVRSVKTRFESSLFDIRQLVQADLFDSELDAADELAKKKFGRGAGAMAGVMLEKHLAQVCESHHVPITKKAPTISDLNEAFKSAGITDVPQWRFVQHLADLRNHAITTRKQSRQWIRSAT
jgi:hypothetical protein